MDFIVLFITNKLMKYSATYKRMFIAATLGALWSVIVVAVPVRFVIIENIFTYVIISSLMIRICVRKNIFKGVCMLYAVTFCTAGIIHMLYYYTSAGYYLNAVILSNRKLAMLVGASLVLMIVMYKYAAYLCAYQTQICKVIIKVNNETIEVMGFTDTGNVLQDNIYRKPVCIAEKSLFEDVLNKLDDYTKVKYHIIPFSSLGCSNGLIEVIMVDVIYIYGSSRRNRGIIKKNALIGLSKEKLSTDNAYQMLLNCEMLR